MKNTLFQIANIIFTSFGNIRIQLDNFISNTFINYDINIVHNTYVILNFVLCFIYYYYYINSNLNLVFIKSDGSGNNNPPSIFERLKNYVNKEKLEKIGFVWETASNSLYNFMNNWDNLKIIDLGGKTSLHLVFEFTGLTKKDFNVSTTLILSSAFKIVMDNLYSRNRLSPIKRFLTLSIFIKYPNGDIKQLLSEIEVDMLKTTPDNLILAKIHTLLKIENPAFHYHKVNLNPTLSITVTESKTTNKKRKNTKKIKPVSLT